MTRATLFRPDRPVSVPLADFMPLFATFAQGSAPEFAWPQPLEVSGLALDSRQVRPGDLYFALPGAKVHGARFAPAVLASGAVGIVSDAEGARICRELEVSAPVVELSDPRGAAALAAAQLYRTGPEALQESGLHTFGVTGTNGKTTTTFFLRALLQALGQKTGLIGTIEISDGEQRADSILTTPEALDVHGLISRMVENSSRAMVMEVSSHALQFHRVDGLRFDVAGFTNLTQDHLDLHGDMESYYQIKAELFTVQHASRGVVDVDGEWGARLAREASVPVATLGVREDADYRIEQITPHGLGHRFTVAMPGGDSERDQVHVQVSLPGPFNVSNAALALAMAHAGGASVEALQTALLENPFDTAVPGRMEIVGRAPAAVVDFAHNPDALERALTSVRERTEGKVIVVFGATGERDTTKRAQMGEIAAQNADVVIVSDDDPHDEDPAQIRAAVLAGVQGAPRVRTGHTSYFEVAPRTEAIEFAVRQATPQDTLLIAGRGHESIQEVQGVPLELDDRHVLRAALISAGLYEPRQQGIES